MQIRVTHSDIGADLYTN